MELINGGGISVFMDRDLKGVPECTPLLKVSIKLF